MVVKKYIYIAALLLKINTAYAVDNTDNESIQEMCSLVSELFNTTLPSGQYDWTSKGKEKYHRLGELVSGDYNMPSPSVETIDGLKKYIRENKELIIIATGDAHIQEKILIGHTLNNIDVVKALNNFNVLYVNTSLTDNANFEEKKKLMMYLKIFSIGVIYITKNDSDGLVQKTNFNDACIQPKPLINWLNHVRN